MSTEEHAADEAAIARALHLERYWRDAGEWDRLADAYADDSQVVTTWFTGTGREFAEASREMAERRSRHSKHIIHPTRIQVRGDRALAESVGEIHNRDTLDGVEVDTTQYCRFYSRMRRTASGWKLASFTGIYQKDTMAPSVPGQAVVLNVDEFLALRPPYRVWAYMLNRKGYHVPQDDRILAEDRPEKIAEFYAGEQAWLAAGD